MEVAWLPPNLAMRKLRPTGILLQRLVQRLLRKLREVYGPAIALLGVYPSGSKWAVQRRLFTSTAKVFTGAEVPISR